jgi:hypothetical protein
MECAGQIARVGKASRASVGDDAVRVSSFAAMPRAAPPRSVPAVWMKRWNHPLPLPDRLAR